MSLKQILFITMFLLPQFAFAQVSGYIDVSENERENYINAIGAALTDELIVGCDQNVLSHPIKRILQKAGNVRLSIDADQPVMLVDFFTSYRYGPHFVREEWGRYGMRLAITTDATFKSITRVAMQNLERHWVNYGTILNPVMKREYTVVKEKSDCRVP
ncbi:MAG: hypothetical protein AB7F59_10115 [Bdellovibrionales bacterium]